jgi:hypothetical protein
MQQTNTDSQSVDLLFITVEMLQKARASDLPRRLDDMTAYLGRSPQSEDGLTFREWSELLRADDDDTYSATTSDLAWALYHFDQPSLCMAIVRILNACFAEVEKEGGKVDPRIYGIAIAMEHRKPITTLMAIAAADAKDEAWRDSGYVTWMAANVAASAAGGTVVQVSWATDRAACLLGDKRVRELLLG